MLKQVQKNKKGFALVMALMILSVAMLTGLFMNSIIVGEVRVSLNTANVVNSYYAAESGIERALYYVTTNELADNVSYYDGLDTPSNSYTLYNNAQYSYATTSIASPSFIATNVSNTNPAHVSIVDPSGEIGSIDWATAPVTGILQWRINDCFPAHASDRIEITQYSFESNFNNPYISKIVAVCDCSSAPSTFGACRNINLNSLSGSDYYRFVFRPLDAEASLLNFSLSEDNGILSETLTQVRGKYKNSEYLLQAKMSALRPTSDIFSYVIFSEEELSKNQ